jgi:di/tripeptidase
VAKEITKEASEAVTTVAVEVHEEEQTALSAHELKQMFKSELGQIEARQRFDLERIEVIRTALADETILYESFQVPTSDQLLGYEYPIVAVDSLLSQAMSNFAAGGYRAAFATLQEIDSSLLAIEAELAQIEITIMNARIQTPVVPDEPVVEAGDTMVEEEAVL